MSEDVETEGKGVWSTVENVKSKEFFSFVLENGI
jgi:hypothetical protein